MALESLDKSGNQPIVSETKRTPQDGADNTNRGLTGHAEMSSMAATRNTNPAPASRQSLSPAADGFLVGAVEYCPPPEQVLNDFVWAVCTALSERLSDNFASTEVRQGFREFLEVVIRIHVKQANGRGR